MRIHQLTLALLFFFFFHFEIIFDSPLLIVNSLARSTMPTSFLSFIRTSLVLTKGSGQDLKAANGLALFPLTLYNL